MVYSLPSSIAVITTLSPAMIGDERPLGTGTFHFTFFSGPNSTGGFASSAMPDPFGPRNRGQASDFSALEPGVANIPATRTVKINGFIPLVIYFCSGREGCKTNRNLRTICGFRWSGCRQRHAPVQGD